MEENDFSINISPNWIRNVFEEVIDSCVEAGGTGGYRSKGVENALAWLTNWYTDFPGDPPRR